MVRNLLARHCKLVMSKKGNLKEIAGLFFKLGLIAFGGPAAHIAMMEDEVVKKKKMDDRRTFS